MHYPFHPLCGRELEVYGQPRRWAQVTVSTEGSSRILIPMWMLHPSAAAFKICTRPLISVDRLLELVVLVDSLKEGSGSGAKGSSARDAVSDETVGSSDSKASRASTVRRGSTKTCSSPVASTAGGGGQGVAPGEEGGAR